MTQIRLVLMYFFMVAHLKHVCASVTDKADRSVVLAPLQVAFLGKCSDQGLFKRSWPFSCPPDVVENCRERGNKVFPTCLDQFCSDVVDSS